MENKKRAKRLPNFISIVNCARAQPTFGGARPTVVQPHQFRTVDVVDGLTEIPCFRAHKWTFHVTGNTKVRLTFHNFNTPEVSERVLGEMKYFLRSALEKCADDGAAPNNIIHIYLDCEGLDFRFAHNPAGIHGTTLQSLLTTPGFNALLERFLL